VRLYQLKKYLLKALANRTPLSDPLTILIDETIKDRDIKVIENKLSILLEIIKKIDPIAVESVVDNGVIESSEFKEKFINSFYRESNFNTVNDISIFLDFWGGDGYAEFNQLTCLYKIDFLYTFLSIFNGLYINPLLNGDKRFVPSMEDLDICYRVIELVEDTIFNSEYDELSPRILGCMFYCASKLYQFVECYSKQLKFLIIALDQCKKTSSQDLRGVYPNNSVNDHIDIYKVTFSDLWINIGVALSNCKLTEKAINHLTEMENCNLLFGVEELQARDEVKHLLQKKIVSIHQY